MKSKAQVIIAGGGPAAAATAYHLAKSGVSVLVLEKSTYPRDKICGDGLTPMAVKEILAMGIVPLEEKGWQVNYGLTVIGGGHKITLPWAKQASLPNYGLTRMRKTLDQRLMQQAIAAGATVIENATVTGLTTDATGCYNGVCVNLKDPVTNEKSQKEFYADFIVDACGAGAKLAKTAGRVALENKPFAVAARAYFKSPRGNETKMESHLELWDGKPNESNLLPGYGWLFPMGDGIVNVGLGSVSSSKVATKLPYKKILETWISNLPPEWELLPENQLGELRSAPLPMAFNREPLYKNGLLLVGDSAGMISPFNGEGIGPAMFAGRVAAAHLVQALGRCSRIQAELALSTYEQEMQLHFGGYYKLGKAFVKLIENPKIMHACTRYGLPHPRLMRFVHKLLSDGYERHGGDAADHVLQILAYLANKV